MITLSKQKENEAKKIGVTIQYLVMADLMAVGYSEEDAFVIAYPENMGRAEHLNSSVRKTVVESAKFNKLLEDRRSRIKDGVAAPARLDEVELVGTEEVMKEILRSAQQQPLGSKERAELFAKYNEIKTKNEQGIEDDSDNISFVFPLKCNQCPLLYSYNEVMKENGGKEIRPVEMGRVIDMAHTIIQAAKDAE